MPRKPKLGGLLTSTQVGMLLGVTRMTINRYSKEGVLPAPRKRGKHGYGYWTPDDVAVARRILNERTANAN